MGEITFFFCRFTNRFPYFGVLMSDMDNLSELNNNVNGILF
jgi:hypothetical protein